MNCAWKELLAILPPGIRTRTDGPDREQIREIRLRLGKKPELTMGRKCRFLPDPVSRSDLEFVINTASRYSPWAASTAAEGYVTAPGGHRIGISGEAVIKCGIVAGIRTPASVCIRVARDFPGIAAGADFLRNNLLLIGPPGSGKTTLLRDLIRRRSEKGPGSIAVIDERGELFPMTSSGYCFDTGCRTDILTGCRKAQGIPMALKTLGPTCIAVDEITEEKDCSALCHAMGCGVNLLATAHASSVKDLKTRPVYRILSESGLFTDILQLLPDQSWKWERMVP